MSITFNVVCAVLAAATAALVVAVYVISRADRRAQRMAVLQLLADHGEMYVAHLLSACEGIARSATMYLLLKAMEDEGLIESRQVSALTGLPRRLLYRITESGQKALKGTMP